MKIDLQKTFDSLDWRFLMEILSSMKFSSIFIDWIKSCVTTPMFSLSINEELVGFFKGARGVRQGNPLFPYLFVLAMNILSKLLDAAARSGVFNFHPKCKRVNLTHLCFVDDLLFFFKGNLNSIMGNQNVLKVFYTFSSLQLNYEKSELFLIGVSKENLMEIQQETGF